MRMSLPTGFWAPNRLLRTDSPMTHTARPERSSVSVKSRPLTISQLPARKWSLVEPVTMVDQLRAW